MAGIIDSGLVDLYGLIWGLERMRHGVGVVTDFKAQGKWKRGRGHSPSEVLSGC